MAKQEMSRTENIAAAEEIERKSKKVALEIFKMIEDSASFVKNERADRGKVLQQLVKDIEQIQRNEELIITEETFKKVREEASRLLSHPGGKDHIVPEIFEILSAMEKKFN